MLDDGGTLRIVKSGEEDAGYGIYRAADIEVNGVRRRGDVLFGGNSVEGREHGNGLLPAALQWAVLHVVSAPAAPLYDAGGERIPQLVVSVPQRLRDAVASLRTGASRYECGIWLGDLPAAKRISFLDRLVVERLDRKCRDVLNVLERCGGDWAQALYTMLFRAMGGNRNREPYIDLASRATYQMVLRERGDIELVRRCCSVRPECWRGAIISTITLPGSMTITSISPANTVSYPCGPGSGRVRVSGRRTGRHENRAARLVRRPQRFHLRPGGGMPDTGGCACALRYRGVGLLATHYVPDGSGERCPRRIGAEKADLLAINAVVPVMFAYGQTTGKGALKDAAFDLLGDIPAENNAIVRSWSGMGVPVRSALDSQALLQLRNEYCTQGRCTDCKVGKSIIKVRDKAFSFR